MKRKITYWIILFFFISTQFTPAQIVSVGSGSYTKTFPGNDEAGRNGYPGGTAQLSGNAVGKPVPTNDWWSRLVKENHTDNLFNYPFTMKTLPKGLVVSYIPNGVIDDLLPITIGVTGLNAPRVTISDYSDWCVKMNWEDGTHQFDVTSGIGMPFLYISNKSGEIAEITVTQGKVTLHNEMMVIEKAKNGASFAVYAPNGSTWSKNGSVYTSSLAGKNYWSIAMLPQSTTQIMTVAADLKKYAYVFPLSTTAKYKYNESTSKVLTTFSTTVAIKEGSNNLMLQGLLPHQWNNRPIGAATNYPYTYNSIRGELKMIAANEFEVENTFHGILPTLPYLDNHSAGFDPAALANKVNALQYDALATWTDSYNEGQVMNRLIQTARIADEIGNTTARDAMLKTIKDRLENWLTASNGEKAFLFYYNNTWSALLGYPAGHGQDSNINDHHFHWGYFIHAASFIEQYEPGWVNKWGEMINLLVRDAASTDRNDTLFPYLRNFSPYAGHSWANGFATFPNGNDQESTSESMQFNSSLIHWGTITGNNAIRDLGIYLYTTEQTAIEEYWLNIYNRNFSKGYPYSLVSRVWGNSYDNGTFWTADIAASYGIEMYPIHGGSLYLGHNIPYATKLWEEISRNTGILKNEANDNLWHDVMWEYLAFTNPAKAIELYDSYPNRNLKFGISDAQTYHWLHAMNALGQVDASVTANYPIAAAFKKGNNDYTYVAHNYGNQPITVHFSTGYELKVPAHKMMTSQSASINGKLSSSFAGCFAGGAVTLTMNVEGEKATRIEWYDGNNKIGESLTAPYTFVAAHLSMGKHAFYGKVYEGTQFNVSNQAIVIVGEQLPYNGIAATIPGVVEAGKYDEFEGGEGQNISYFDTTPNGGDSRKSERVDVVSIPTEGLTVGNIASGEWIEYSVDVASSGIYNVAFRYACGNNNGGGAFTLSLDNKLISEPIRVPKTANWETFATQTLNNIPLIAGRHILRIDFAGGELNIGKFTFTRNGDLAYPQPIAHTNGTVKVLLPATTAVLDASSSTNPSAKALQYKWEQIYGPTLLSLENEASATLKLTGLQEGIYKIALTVTNTEGYSDHATQFVIVSSSDNITPSVKIVSPQNGEKFIEQTDISLLANATDLDGSITQVEFFNNHISIGTVQTSPYKLTWAIPNGSNQITATATDNKGATTTSDIISVEGTKAPDCMGENTSGDYSYRFSESTSNPTLTFIPKNSSIGAGVCLLYYGTGSGPYPGYNVKPNIPYPINAIAGSTIHFYYTYSTSAGEKNTMNNKDSYVIGSCINTGVDEIEASRSTYYPNPVAGDLHLQFAGEATHLIISDLMGKEIDKIKLYNNDQYTLPMGSYDKGIYLISVLYENRVEVLKIMKL